MEECDGHMVRERGAQEHREERERAREREEDGDGERVSPENENIAKKFCWKVKYASTWDLLMCISCKNSGIGLKIQVREVFIISEIVVANMKKLL